MKQGDAIAVAEFLRDGGQIMKVDADVPATAQEVLSYLASCGVSARYYPGDPKPYLCQKRRLSLHALVQLANRYRRARRQQPFTLRT